MCKPMLVTTPFVLLLLDYWPLGRLRAAAARPDSAPSLRRLLLEKAPLLAVALAISAVTVTTQKSSMVSTADLSIQARIANAAVSYVAYLRQTFWPTGLAVFYPHPKDNLPEWQVLGAFALLIAISGSVIWAGRRRPYLLVGWFWYLGMLAPVIGFMQSGQQARADRFTYLPHVGLSIAIVWWAANLSRNWRQRWLVALVALSAVTLLGLCAWQQTRHWRDTETLWTHTLASTTRNDVAHHNLGMALASRGRIDEAIEYYRMALEFEPDFAEAHYNLGLALVGRGRVDEAIEHYRMALEFKPDYADAHNNLATALANRGLIDEAVEHYHKALEFKPDYAEAHNNLAAALADRGQVDEAIEHYRKAMEFKPDFAEAHYNLATALAGRGLVGEALAHYQKALDLASARNDKATADIIRAQIDRLRK
jgi:tetratricopeptide (TPR) repeat protein